ncbi:MAG TPA: AAA family ATPase [Gaiellaceae bacterium]|nr:AAA family ATPase [Gaiellaceae bacterium]
MGDEVFGREVELGAVERVLAALPEEPAALVLEGEAGIGKTTIWLEAVRLGHLRGFRVLQARPAESEAKLSYAALADLVGSAFDELGGAVLPAVQERALAAALLRGDVDQAAEPRTIATGLVGLLAALVDERPVLVAIDDVPWLDPASEQALTFAARRLPRGVGMVLTRRTERPEVLPLGLARALPESRVERVLPGALSLAALHHLVKDRLGSSLPRPVLAQLAEVSGGNPFFALEIARALAAERRERGVAEPLPVPQSLQELVTARVQGLSDAARQAVLAAAAVSQPTAALVAAALEGEGDARAALIEAEEAGVLLAERDRLRFAHPLLASAVYGSASHERRQALHERLAAAVSSSEERARHLALSATEPDEVIAAELEQAARRSARRGAQQAAAELFEASRRLTPPGRAEELTRRELGEAAALMAAGDIAGARSLAEPAAGSPVASLRARARALLADILWIGGNWRAATEQLVSALAEAEGDPELIAGIYPKLLNYTVPNDPARALAHAETATAALDPEQAPGALASVVFDGFWARLLLGEGERRELFERWRELEEKAGPEAPKSVIPLIHFNTIDDFDAARARYAVEEQWYRVRGEEGWRAERMAHVGFTEFSAGRWDLAERLIEESCATIAQLDRPGPWTMPYRLRSFVDAGRGRTEGARATLLPLIEDAERAGRTWWEALLLSGLAFVEFAAADHRAVDRTLARMRERLDAIGTWDMLPDRSEPFHAESLAALAEPAQARQVLERLEERGRVFPRGWITAALPRARALVLAAEGDVGAALAALDELDVAEASKRPFDLGSTLLVRGRLQRRARQKRAAAESLGEALEIFERLGALPWIEQARHELDRVGLRRAPADLTATELRVAELAAGGLTNKEVAAKAFMSPKTVEANLARVYRKLGIRSRAELGARIESRHAP